MTRYVEYRYPFVFLPVSFWVSPKKEGGRKTIAVTAHAASRLHAPEGRRRVLTSTIQTRSTVNPGTPHRRAALLANTSVPIVSRKEVADSRLSPGSKCRAERNRTGHHNCHPYRRGYRSARVSTAEAVACSAALPGCERKPEPYASGGSNFRNHPLCQPRLLHTGVTFGKTSPKNVP